jgi:hypothetical protein
LSGSGGGVGGVVGHALLLFTVLATQCAQGVLFVPPVPLCRNYYTSSSSSSSYLWLCAARCGGSLG